MALVAPVPHMMNAAVLKVGTDNYEKAVSSAKLTPTTPTAQVVGIDGSVTVVSGTPTWKLTLGYPQDLVTATSIQNYLQNNAGTTKVVELTPQAGGKKFTVTVMCIAPEVGGDAATVQSGTITLDVQGQPTIA